MDFNGICDILKIMATEQNQDPQFNEQEQRFRRQLVWVIAAGILFILLLWLFTAQFNRPLA